MDLACGSVHKLAKKKSGPIFSQYGPQYILCIVVFTGVFASLSSVFSMLVVRNVLCRLLLQACVSMLSILACGAFSEPLLDVGRMSVQRLSTSVQERVTHMCL